MESSSRRSHLEGLSTSVSDEWNVGPGRSGLVYKGEPNLHPASGTLSPLVPLSPSRDSGQALRAFKGEGERRTEAHACAKAQAWASNSVLGEEGTSRLYFFEGSRDGDERQEMAFAGPDGVEGCGPPPVRPFDCTQGERPLRRGDGFPIGVGNDGLGWEDQRARWCGLTRQIPRGASGWEGGGVGMGHWGVG